MNRARNVRVVENLASDAAGRRCFTVRSEATDPGACANSVAYIIDGGEPVDVEMNTLDSLVEDLGSIPNVLKIDVEGAELEVLRGAEVILKTHRPAIACAVHPEPLDRLGHSVGMLVTFLEERGYRCFAFDGNPIEMPGFENVLFLPVDDWQ